MKVFLRAALRSQSASSVVLAFVASWQWSPQLSALAGTAAVIAIVISGSLGVEIQ